MRMEPTRKCSSFTDVEKCSDFRRSAGDYGLPNDGFGGSNGSFGASNDEFGRSNLRKHSQFRERPNLRNHSSFQFHHRLALIQAYGDWFKQWLDKGWDGYLFTFMFNQLPGSRRAMVQQMHQQLLRWYGRLATRIIRKPRSPVWVPFLPKGIFVPDLPVPKRCKQEIRDVSINDGLHMHGLVVANRRARITDTLDAHFEEEAGIYLIGNLQDIDVERITDRAKYVADYGLKGLKRWTFSEDDILVLPRTLSELPGRHLRHPTERGLINAQP
jgi:hypothetical protein